uniref:tryptophan 5-hydroxylase 1 n=1 Tax=Myxine glutinosa TaxID=7769 RepID=UPI00358E5231
MNKVGFHLREDIEVQDNRDTTSSGLDKRGSAVLVFSLKNEIGGLLKALKVFQEKHVQLIHIESRTSRRCHSELEIFVECDGGWPALREFVNFLRAHASDVVALGLPGCGLHDGCPSKFSPRADCKMLQEVSMNHRMGQPIPRIEYTTEEIRTWGTVYRELNKLYPTHACREYLKNLPLLVKHCGYQEESIPQLEVVSHFLKERTGFSIRPVAGYLSPRDFLAGLAFRVFHCTQYVRHSSDPLYTPEPDTCHELLGHVPLLAEPSFAQFSQELGLASLGASDEDVKNLATCYFFTVEFGLCKQEGQFRVYGAGLLSSIGELQHVLSENSRIKPFDPMVVCKQECLVTTFQESYFVAESFEDAKEKMREFAKTIRRPFVLRYNPYTQAIDVLSDVQSVSNLVSDLRGELTVVSKALHQLSAKPRP